MAASAGLFVLISHLSRRSITACAHAPIGPQSVQWPHRVRNKHLITAHSKHLRCPPGAGRGSAPELAWPDRTHPPPQTPALHTRLPDKTAQNTAPRPHSVRPQQNCRRPHCTGLRRSTGDRRPVGTDVKVKLGSPPRQHTTRRTPKTSASAPARSPLTSTPQRRPLRSLARDD